MAVDEDKVYYVNAPFSDEVKITYGYYDIAKDTNKEWRIQQVDYPNNIAIDRIGGKMFISSYIMDGKYPSYTAPGYVNEYTLDGKFVKRYDIGVGPAAIFFDKY